ncbi:MAG: hypothetical protein A3J38_07295 [Gammaproteobacteria bacterium RIFCSPHIGHO2_12_FULL_45_9]|nr:MAG: hypothetical protein A3J38_07295 [Gammaproteobacteria bacterium RIFCSPHIGHO2_12_FULL_45_9]
MQTPRSQFGFAMLEVSLAILAIVLASIGCLSLYMSGQTRQTQQDLASELTAIGNEFSLLNTAGLTQSGLTSGSDLATLLYNSKQLPAQMFQTSGSSSQMTSPVGLLTFSKVTASGFSVTFPGSTLITTDTQQKGFLSLIKNTYQSCSSSNLGHADNQVTCVMSVAQ